VIVPPPPTTELGKHTAVLYQGTPFAIGLLLLLVVIPIRVTPFEICFACDGQDRNLVENGFHPQSLYGHANISNICIRTAIVGRCEGDADLFPGLEPEAGEVSEVSGIEVGTISFQKFELFGGQHDIPEL
jgi:hypothetical protein